MMPDFRKLNSARTARTYPVAAGVLAAAIGKAVEKLPRWTLADAGDEELRAVRKTRTLGFEDNVTVRLVPSPVGAHTNTHASFESASRVGTWDLGQNARNLKELLAATERELKTDN